MKKILILCSNMNIGGFQKSLINLLLNFDYTKYEIDLFLLHKEGVFLNSIPKSVNILEIDDYDSNFFHNTLTSLKLLLKNKNIVKLFVRLLIGIIAYFDKGYGAILTSKFLPKINKHYDCCIDYNGQYLNYYMIDSINAKKKITYFHSDYAKWDFYKNADRIYYKYADAIITISEICVQSLINYFPEFKSKIYCVENIITKETVEGTPINNKLFKVDKLCLLTVGRVCVDKGLDLACEAAKYLKQNNIQFNWFWIGPGNHDKENLDIIKKYDVGDVFLLLGPSSNPFSYIEKCDIAVYPSKFEGKSVVIEETKIINKPIVVTNFSTVYDQIENEKTGIIVGMSGLEVYQGIKNLIENPKKREKIVNYQKKCCHGNKNEVNKLYRIIEES